MPRSVNPRRATNGQCWAVSTVLSPDLFHVRYNFMPAAIWLKSFNRDILHDLQGSLGGMAERVRVAVEAIQPGGGMAVARRVLPLSVTEAERSTELMGTLLTLACANDLNLRESAVHLNAMMQEVNASMALVRPNVARTRLIVAELPLVHGDINLLRPVLTNLIGNTMKFLWLSPAGRCRCARRRGSGDTRSCRLDARQRHWLLA